MVDARQVIGPAAIFLLVLGALLLVCPRLARSASSTTIRVPGFGTFTTTSVGVAILGLAVVLLILFSRTAAEDVEPKPELTSLKDDFSSPELRPDVWGLSRDPTHIYPREGALTIAVAAADAALARGGGGRQSMSVRPPNLEEISFTMKLTKFRPGPEGGAAFVGKFLDGTEFTAGVNYGTKPTVQAVFTPREGSQQFGEAVEIAVGRAYPFRIFRQGREVIMEVGGQELNRFALRDPTTGFDSLGVGWFVTGGANEFEAMMDDLSLRWRQR